MLRWDTLPNSISIVAVYFSYLTFVPFSPTNQILLKINSFLFPCRPLCHQYVSSIGLCFCFPTVEAAGGGMGRKIE